MPDKLQTYANLAGETAKQITSGWREWTAFLETASRMYKYMDTLGKGYSAAELKAVLAGQREHSPRPYHRAEPQNHLLIDIQAKLREGKGGGYERWAKSYNLKEMAKTVAYLQDHGLMNYEILCARTKAATARFDELSDKIKAAEKRMAEIAVMRTQIINYAKTREVYAAYRKAGYSKKFLDELGSEIAIHKAAKRYFDEQKLKSFPTVKSLQAEYAGLLAEKKAAYAEYREARDEMKELLTAKSIIERILGKEREEKRTITEQQKGR